MGYYLEILEQPHETQLDVLVWATHRKAQNGEDVVAQEPCSLIHLGHAFFQRRELVWERPVEVHIRIVLEMVAGSSTG